MPRRSAPASNSLAGILDRFADQRVLVLGDSILDHYVTGSVERTSPEAPVPVLRVEQDTWLPGGAANVARNITAAGGRAVYVSVRGEDGPGRRLAELMASDPRLQTEFVIDPSRPTTLKTRCMAQGQQMLRLDREDSSAMAPAVRDKVFRAIKKLLPSVTGVVFSDYAKGVLEADLTARVVEACRERKIEIVVDPKGINYRKYSGATLLTPNRKEAQEATGVRITDESGAQSAAKLLLKAFGGEAVYVTLGADGVYVCPRKGTPRTIPARAREVYDVTGAGDTFIAICALARFAGADFGAAAELGNVAAGIVVGRSGVATVTRAEIEREMGAHVTTRKLRHLADLVRIREEARTRGRRFVVTNGCFDMLNVRHVRLLEQSRALGDILLVALNSDDSVRTLKGPPRPLLNEAERVELIASLPYVDYVTVFEGETPCGILEALQPDLLVKGTNVEAVVGREIVEKAGGEVRQIDLDVGPTAEEVIGRAVRGGKP